MVAIPLAHRRTVILAVLVALVVTLLAPGTARAADADAEHAFVAAVNQERAAAGLAAVSVAADLVGVARQHAVVMADGQDLHHNPNLTTQVSGWQKVGENVGKGPSVAPIQQAFMESPAHRANVLDPDWTEIGVGVEARDGRLWVVEVFRQPEAAAAPAPPPEPAPAPAPQTTAEPVATTAPAPPATEAPATAGEGPRGDEPGPAATPQAPAGDRTLVMLTRVAAEDAALDAA